ncbi:unnamed protein product [Schistosoma margrebowiei]|uniref:Uncharacterized protein n=1 Tax=Schistosoma margrebowiei TaxID=48269 RepID=A0A183N7A6_9TREM|nr:unnamed protein product [Schistosoma margrebowiei]
MYLLLLGYLENTFLSPFNIYTALGMILCGSANNTNAELIKAMQLSDCLEQEKIHSAIGELLADLSKPDESVEIIVGNRFYVNEDAQIEKRFKNIIKQHYNALAEHVSMNSALSNFVDPECAQNRINQWVSEQTNGTIQELIPREALSEGTSAVVVSTTYFKGSIIYLVVNNSIFKSDFYYLIFYYCVLYLLSTLCVITFDRFMESTFPLRGFTRHLIISVPLLKCLFRPDHEALTVF